MHSRTPAQQTVDRSTHKHSIMQQKNSKHTHTYSSTSSSSMSLYLTCSQIFPALPSSTSILLIYNLTDSAKATGVTRSGSPDSECLEQQSMSCPLTHRAWIPPRPGRWFGLEGTTTSPCLQNTTCTWCNMIESYEVLHDFVCLIKLLWLCILKYVRNQGRHQFDK